MASFVPFDPDQCGGPSLCEASPKLSGLGFRVQHSLIRLGALSYAKLRGSRYMSLVKTPSIPLDGSGKLPYIIRYRNPLSRVKTMAHVFYLRGSPGPFIRCGPFNLAQPGSPTKTLRFLATG